MQNPTYDRKRILEFVKQTVEESSELSALVDSFQPGDIFFRQGSKITHLYLMLEGEVVLEHEREDGTTLDLITLRQGHFVGLVAFTTGNHSLTTGTAKTPCKALCIKQDEFDRYMNDHSKLKQPLQQLMLSNMADRFMTNVRLESQMNSLNHELEEESDQLKEAYQKLEDSQQRMVHQEKMATLGELVAGFAHEVNNPAAALLRSSEMLKENFEQANDGTAKSMIFEQGLQSQPLGSSEIRERMLHIQKTFPWIKERAQVRKLAQMPDLALELIQKNKKKIPIDELIQQFEAGKFIHNIQVASERIANLVKSLKSYSRQDNNDSDMIDVRDGIKDTILILSNRLKYLNLQLDLKDIPQTCAKMGELNQVWTNILVNACDVLEDGGEIKIRTKAEGEYKIVVEIVDNGPGIPEDVLPRIFEPNFTTKNQGAKFGLGLGLAISNEIIRQHGGFTKCLNRKNGGAKFQIILPVRDCV